MRYQIRSSTCNFDVDEKDRSLMIHFSFFVERQRERESRRKKQYRYQQIWKRNEKNNIIFRS